MKPTSITKHNPLVEPEFAEVKEWFDQNLSPDTLDLEDQRVYEYVFHDGRFAAIFQATERGMQQLLKKSKPRSITDIGAVQSIYRPGPLTAGVDKAYVADKNRVEQGETLTYEHPAIERVLSDTYGHLIFQENFMEIGKEFGLSWDDCDKLRKVLVKKSIGTDVNDKKAAESLRIRELFKLGAVERGLPLAQAEALWEKMCAFNGYGFNKSLHGNTLIKIYDSSGIFIKSKKIIDIAPGEYVQSRDEKTGENIYVKVKALHDHGIIPVIEYTFSNGEKVKCTPNHKFRTTCGQMLPIQQIVDQSLDVVSVTQTLRNLDNLESYRADGSTVRL